MDKRRVIARYDSKSGWRNINGLGTLSSPILALGEVALETNSGLLKVGNGVATFDELPYISRAYFEVDTIADRDAIPTLNTAFYNNRKDVDLKDYQGDNPLAPFSSDLAKIRTPHCVCRVRSGFDNQPQTFVLSVPSTILTQGTASEVLAAVENNEYWEEIEQSQRLDRALPASDFEAGVAVGDVVGFNGAQYVKVLANVNSPGALFIVSSIRPSSQVVYVCAIGLMDTTNITDENNQALVPGTYYYVSTRNAGKLTSTPVMENATDVSKPILCSLSPLYGFVIQERGNALAANAIAVAQGITIDPTTNEVVLGGEIQPTRSPLTKFVGGTITYEKNGVGYGDSHFQWGLDTDGNLFISFKAGETAYYFGASRAELTSKYGIDFLKESYYNLGFDEAAVRDRLTKSDHPLAGEDIDVAFGRHIPDIAQVAKMIAEAGGGGGPTYTGGVGIQIAGSTINIGGPISSGWKHTATTINAEIQEEFKYAGQFPSLLVTGGANPTSVYSKKVGGKSETTEVIGTQDTLTLIEKRSSDYGLIQDARLARRGSAADYDQSIVEVAPGDLVNMHVSSRSNGSVTMIDRSGESTKTTLGASLNLSDFSPARVIELFKNAVSTFKLGFTHLGLADINKKWKSLIYNNSSYDDFFITLGFLKANAYQLLGAWVPMDSEGNPEEYDLNFKANGDMLFISGFIQNTTYESNSSKKFGLITHYKVASIPSASMPSGLTSNIRFAAGMRRYILEASTGDLYATKLRIGAIGLGSNPDSTDEQFDLYQETLYGFEFSNTLKIQ